jgi:hypothetical protein
MKNSILIDQVNYFWDLEGENFNAKVVYSKGGKFYHACIYVCFFRNQVYFPDQPKECKVYAGLENEVNKYLKF